jgi:hypothetical protein
MNLCRFCNQPLRGEGAICIYCGYDPKTDRVDPNFKAHPEKLLKKEIARTRKGIDPRVKSFAFWGVVLVLFSILFKYNFRFGAIMFDLNQVVARVKQGKPPVGKVEDRRLKRDGLFEWQSVRGYLSPQDQKKYKEMVIEGIFFDPSGKSLVTINGTVVAEGEYFKTVLVARIKRDSVEVVIDGETLSLSVNQRISLPQNK